MSTVVQRAIPLAALLLWPAVGLGCRAAAVASNSVCCGAARCPDGGPARRAAGRAGRADGARQRVARGAAALCGNGGMHIAQEQNST